MRQWILLLGCLWLATCAAPPLTLYTLDTPIVPTKAAPLGKLPIVIAVARVTVPDEFDTEDIVIRDGNMLRRSRRGRWSTRLSLAITSRLTGQLAARYPKALVTDRPLTEVPSDRVLVNVGRLDITTGGVATLDADWLVIPRDAAAPTRRDRMHITTFGPVATDQDIVALLGSMLDQLAAGVEIPGLPAKSPDAERSKDSGAERSKDSGAERSKDSGVERSKHDHKRPKSHDGKPAPDQRTDAS